MRLLICFPEFICHGHNYTLAFNHFCFRQIIGTINTLEVESVYTLPQQLYAHDANFTVTMGLVAVEVQLFFQEVMEVLLIVISVHEIEQVRETLFFEVVIALITAVILITAK